jgi:hypothetical protein
MNLKQILLVHKTHLDVGFTDTAAAVTRQYLDRFIPAAVARAREMNPESGPPRFVWTTGSWIIWKALRELPEGPRADLEEAIHRGWVVWHALPFTFHTELLSPELLRLSLRFGQDLDTRFNRKTVSAKMTDVPGHTRGLVLILAEAGIRFLHLGVNPASRVPDVPPLFRWRCGDAELITAYSCTYGSITTAPGLETGLCFLHTNDNLGPPEASVIEAEEEALRLQYGVDQVVASGMDSFAEALFPLREHLPVLEKEIGDSWIHGAGADPVKIADYLALRREADARAEDWMQRPLDEIGPGLESLLLLPEHTCGLDVKAWFGDHAHFQTGELRTLRRSHRVRNLEASWAEQRAYVGQTLDTFPNLASAVEESRAVRGAPSIDGMDIHDVNAPLRAGRWLIRLEPATGCLSQLTDLETGQSHVPKGGRLGGAILKYEQYGTEDYQDFLDAYMGPPPRPWWAEEDFNKFGLPGRRRQSATLRGHGVWIRRYADRTELVARQQFYGAADLLDRAPEDPALHWTIHHDRPHIELRVGWNRKAPTRKAEALWLGFRLPEDATFRFPKLGMTTDPVDIVPGGGIHLHAIQDHVDIQTPFPWRIHALDSVLLSTNGGRLLDPSPIPSPRIDSLWFNLFNNIWNTNFPLWTEGPMGYRFRLTFCPPPRKPPAGFPRPKPRSGIPPWLQCH